MHQVPPSQDCHSQVVLALCKPQPVLPSPLLPRLRKSAAWQLVCLSTGQGHYLTPQLDQAQHLGQVLGQVMDQMQVS
jgi:hypothetical protein